MSLPLNKKTTANLGENMYIDSLSAEQKEKYIEDEKNLQKQITAELLQKSKERKIASDKKKRQLENKKWWQFWI